MKRIFRNRTTCALLGAAAFLLSAPPSALAEEMVNLYIDAVRGSDNNDGKSPESALQTLNAVQQATDALEESIPVTWHLARGSVWRESKDGLEATTPERVRAWGRDGLTVLAFGEGEKPELRGFEVLPNEGFQQPDAEAYPNVWSQRVTPPPGYFQTYQTDAQGARTGLLVGERQPLRAVWTPDSPLTHMRDFVVHFEGIDSHEDALAFLNEHEGTFYPRHHDDGTVAFFVNSGSNPVEDGLTYEYKAHPAVFRGENLAMENIVLSGTVSRHGLAAQKVRLDGVEVRHGNTHQIFIPDGILRNVVSFGDRTDGPEMRGKTKPDGPVRPLYGTSLGETHSSFHTHGRNAGNLVYDRCVAENAGIAFFDHQAEAHREWAVLKDSQTRNVNNIFGHGVCTAKVFIIGHRHLEKSPGEAHGQIGGISQGENFVEDSIFRTKGLGSLLTNGNSHLRMRNSVVHADFDGRSPIHSIGDDGDLVYENSTVIVDFKNDENLPFQRRLVHGPIGDGKIVFRNCVVAAINVPDSSFVPMWGDSKAAIVFENCVLTPMAEIPEAAGIQGKDYVFVDASEIFAGDPGSGEYHLRKDGPMAGKDVGFREGRKPVYRPQAEELEADLSAQMGGF